ncbi:hypothetical protein B0H13DRAFT_2369973 [Mycena leptocephala]|nr:hypothetical protein B0H13DRAFT_2369973 [Mycena leptocephala]
MPPTLLAIPGHENTFLHDRNKDAPTSSLQTASGPVSSQTSTFDPFLSFEYALNGVIFSFSFRANEQTDGYSNYVKRSVKTDAAEEVWDSLCPRAARGGVPRHTDPCGITAPTPVIRVPSSARPPPLQLRLQRPCLSTPLTSAAPPYSSTGWESPRFVRSSASPSPMRPASGGSGDRPLLYNSPPPSSRQDLGRTSVSIRAWRSCPAVPSALDATAPSTPSSSRAATSSKMSSAPASSSAAGASAPASSSAAGSRKTLSKTSAAGAGGSGEGGSSRSPSPDEYSSDDEACRSIGRWRACPTVLSES